MRKLLLLLLICPIGLIGQIPAKLHNTYVHDYAHVLTADQVENLNRTIKNIDTSNKIKFAIILINELPTNYSIEDYARDIGNKWEVGKGIVYVAAINQRKQRLEVSAHLEGVIPDITAKHITDNIKPFFKSKDYYGGIAGMVNDIGKLIKQDVAPPKIEKQKGTLAAPEKTAIAVFTLVIFLAAVLAFIIFRERRRDRKFRKLIEEEKEKITARQESRNQDAIDKYPVWKRSYTPPKRN